MWLNYGEKQLEWIGKCSQWQRGNTNLDNYSVCKQLLDLKIPVIKDGELAEDFMSGKRKAQPLVFCHGLTGFNNINSGTCRDLASNGMIVFSMDFHDGTCCYTEQGDDICILPDYRSKYGDEHACHKQME